MESLFLKLESNTTKSPFIPSNFPDLVISFLQQPLNPMQNNIGIATVFLLLLPEMTFEN